MVNFTLRDIDSSTITHSVPLKLLSKEFCLLHEGDRVINCNEDNFVP